MQAPTRFLVVKVHVSAFNKSKALVAVFSEHFEISRSPVDTSIRQIAVLIINIDTHHTGDSKAEIYAHQWRVERMESLAHTHKDKTEL